MQNVGATLSQWEVVIINKNDGSYDLLRFKVPGGWLVKTFGEESVAVNYMPDGNHIWTIEGCKSVNMSGKRDPAARSKVLMELDRKFSST